ncbi:MAG: acetate--CoA ligase family protein [Candidatus Bathyarchaeia archaeon]
MLKVKEVIGKALSEGRKGLLEPEAKTICKEYGIPTPEFALAKNVDEAIDFSEKIGYPVVLKIVSPDIIHKTEAGGVLIDLKNRNDVKKGFKKILENSKNYKPDARIVGVLVQKMAPQSTEIIVGGIKDPQFGSTLMFGLGGIFVEVLKDVTFRVVPITEEDAKEMIKEIKAYPVLKGYRGQKPRDEDAITKILLASSRLMLENEEIDQMDLNPIMVYERGASVVDARIILA